MINLKYSMNLNVMVFVTSKFSVSKNIHLHEF